MGTRYIVSRTNVTPTPGNDLLTIVVPASRAVELVEVSVNGLHTASAAQECAAGVSSGGTTGGSPITPGKLDPDSASAASTVNTTWAAQPTLNAADAVRLGFNALGGAYRWVKPPGGRGPVARNSGNISIRSIAGANPMSVHAIFEEI